MVIRPSLPTPIERIGGEAYVLGNRRRESRRLASLESPPLERIHVARLHPQSLIREVLHFANKHIQVSVSHVGPTIVAR